MVTRNSCKMKWSLFFIGIFHNSLLFPPVVIKLIKSVTFTSRGVLQLSPPNGIVAKITVAYELIMLMCASR